MKSRILENLIAYPFLLGIYPVLGLYSVNMHSHPAGVIFMPLLLVLLSTLVLFLILRLVLKNSTRAGLIVSLCLLWFYTYGIVEGLLIRAFYMIFGAMDLPILITTLLLLGLLIVEVIRIKRDLKKLNILLNVVLASIVGVCLLQICYNLVFYSGSFRKPAIAERQTEDIELDPNADNLPDIYYIILDAFAGSDILKELYGYNDGEFIGWLENSDFFVASGSGSNYSRTIMSLASSLNFGYLNEFAGEGNENSKNVHALVEYIDENRTISFLRKRGYKYVFFSSGFPFVFLENAELKTAPSVRQLSEFSLALLTFTPYPALWRAFYIKTSGYAEDVFSFHRKKVLYVIDEVGKIRRQKRPLFVVAHVFTPHTPFVFGKDGEVVCPGSRFHTLDGDQLIDGKKYTADDYRKGYRNQTIYTVKKIKSTIDNILSDRKHPAVVIIQGDHGPGMFLKHDDAGATNMKERLSILNAVYFPDGNYKKLPEDLTPVNTFRIVLNKFFGTNHAMLENRHYFSPHKWPFRLVDVTGRFSTGPEGKAGTEKE
ncbi:MAG: hypothetical protein ACYS8W_00660 [Planctomycetota bacterium]|jgi:hypothetical protein